MSTNGSGSKVNQAGVYTPDDILNQIVSFNGLFEKIFGKLLPPLVYSAPVENGVHILESIYWYRDVRKLFPKKLLKGEFDRVSETVFRIIKDPQWTTSKESK